jgi:rfaE bifunctional protein nucleotidyltransferase chain/domain
MITVYTTGVFDLLHPGHINILRRARAMGDRLIVGVQEDDSVLEQKGRRPIMSCKERMFMLKELPFVDLVLSYHDIDQRKMIKILKPKIIVQGGDWLKTGDRSTVINFARKNNIKIIQFPYTKEVSTTNIKERVYNSLRKIKRENMLDFDLTQRLRIVPISKLLVYESNDPLRTKKLIDRISRSQLFFNPITVGSIDHDGHLLVIDGANRLEALKKLDAKYVPVQIVNYFNPDEVDLQSNEHYLDIKQSIFLKLLRDKKIKIKESKKDSYTMNNNLCYIYTNKKVYNILASKDLIGDVKILNRLVNSYKNIATVTRKSDVGNLLGDSRILIKFKTFNTSDIIEIVTKKMQLESGITWHSIQNSIIHLGMPLSILKEGFKSDKEATKYAKKIIKEKINNQAIRRYFSSVCICDEWEL